MRIILSIVAIAVVLAVLGVCCGVHLHHIDHVDRRVCASGGLVIADQYEPPCSYVTFIPIWVDKIMILTPIFHNDPARWIVVVTNGHETARLSVSEALFQKYPLNSTIPPGALNYED